MTPLIDFKCAIAIYHINKHTTGNSDACITLAIVGGRIALAALAAFAVYTSGVSLLPALVIGACLSSTITLLATGGGLVCYGVATLIKALAVTSFSIACPIVVTGILSIGIGMTALHFYRHRKIFSLAEYFIPSLRMGFDPCPTHGYDVVFPNNNITHGQ